MAKRRSPIWKGKEGRVSLGLSHLNPKVSEIGLSISENQMHLSDDVDSLKVLKEAEVAKARVVAHLEKFHEAAMDLRRKTKEMNQVSLGCGSKGTEEVSKSLGLATLGSLGCGSNDIKEVSETLEQARPMSLGCGSDATRAMREMLDLARSLSLGCGHDGIEEVS